jgi:diaminohydroxyphosphoribosylaminopyrimidine deaminase/5-amino-6-(5-phosphoribosylamino)uracil reductase
VRCGEGHAEVNAFASVRPEDEHLLKDATIYVSLEPCAHYGKTPPCCDLIIRKGVKRCVVGCVDPFAKVQGRGIQKIREAGIEVTVGVLEKECQQLNKRFFTYHQHHRPYILLKWAQTANGFIDDHGQALALSTPYTKMLVHKLRSEYDAILVGRVTDEREHPQLNVREWYGKDPVRLVMGKNAQIESMADISSPLWGDRGGLSLMVEGGRQTLQSFIDADLWDEAYIERSDMVLGDGVRAPKLKRDLKGRPVHVNFA